MHKIMGELYRDGFAGISVPGFDLGDRKWVAKKGLDVIDLCSAESDPAGDIGRLLTTTLAPELETQTNPTEFGVRGPRNTTDPKTYLHIGYQTVRRVLSADKKLVPSALRELASVLPDALDALTDAWKVTMIELGISEQLMSDLMPDDRMLRVVVLRALQYHNFAEIGLWDEVFQPHADLGLGTIELFKSDEQVFKSIPLAPSLLQGEYDPVRIKTIADMYTRNARYLPRMIGNGAFFLLSAGWYGLHPDAKGTGIPADLPVGFHGGHKDYEGVLDSRDNDFATRANLVAFFHPSLKVLVEESQPNPIYTVPSVATCRPFSQR